MNLPSASVTDRVIIFALGGTIAMVPGDKPGAVPSLSADDLIRAIPELSSFELAAVSFRQKPSAHLTFDDLEALASAIEDGAAQGARGIVITQGTDTIEEVAFALDMLVDVAIPVVITGAMRNPSLAGADGPANLLAAVRIASSSQAAGRGVVVAFNDEIHAARFVKKRHTSSTSAFVSPNAGPIGWISENDVIFAMSPRRGGHVTRIAHVLPAKVGLISLTIDFDCEILEFAMSGAFNGLVIEGLGGGHASSLAAEMLGRAAEKMPVLLTSRAGAGQALRSTYGFTGSEIDLLSRSVLDAGWLDGPKSRVLMTLALRHDCGRDGLKALVAQFRS